MAISTMSFDQGWASERAVTGSTELSQRIDSIERGYEYLLAYAAQGRQEETGSEVRSVLEQIYGALDGLKPLAQQALADETAAKRYDIEPFLEALQRDAHAARGAIGLALSRASISSLLIDNLNASVHLRALLTDVFLLEQALKTPSAS
jgi:hypothetical protein